jgi:DNA-directed RNA polymerase subunit RPC12/RpoP
MQFKGYTTCPGCGFEIFMGVFEGSVFQGVSDNTTLVSKEPGITEVEPYRDFKVFMVYCPDCGLRFFVSSLMKYDIRK